MTQDKAFKVAIISYKPLARERRRRVKDFHPNLKGFVDLGNPKVVHQTHLKSYWDKRHKKVKPMSRANVNKLNEAISK